MQEPTCTNCGRVNPPGATMCGWCGQAFSASPYVDAIFAEPQRGADPRFARAPGVPGRPYAPPYAEAAAVNSDAEHLKILSVCHFVVGAIIGAFACIPVIHLVVGIVLLVAGSAAGGAEGAPPAIVGLMFVLVASVFILGGWTLAACVIAAGRFLTQRRRHTFCLVVACLLCMFAPLGTVLGVFTILVLLRPTVKALFDRPPAF
jgi:hypothetical protein